MLAWVATAWILATYVVASRAPARMRWFNRANAWGCFPILATEVAGHAWQAFVLTAVFGLVGWWGLQGDLW